MDGGREEYSGSESESLCWEGGKGQVAVYDSSPAPPRLSKPFPNPPEKKPDTWCSQVLNIINLSAKTPCLKEQ